MNLEANFTKMTLNHLTNKEARATLKFPFDVEEHAKIAYQVLSVDKEPRRNFVQKELELENSHLIVHFTADQVKNLRTAITSFFENFLLCQETIATFGTETTSTENAGTHTSTTAT